MSRIYLQTYGAFSIQGNDFAAVDSEITNKRRILFSPDDKHSISINFLRDGLLLFTNESNANFEFTVGRNNRSMALIKFKHTDEAMLFVNNNFQIKKSGVTNREIHANPNCMMSKVLHFDISGVGIGRVDLKVDESGFAACIFSDLQLMFVRMNGNHVVPRLNEFVQREIDRTEIPIERMRHYICSNPTFAREIAQNYILDWFKWNESTDEVGFIQKVAEFLRVNRSI